MFRHSIVLAKIRAWLQRPCCRHAPGGVSVIPYFAFTNLADSPLVQRYNCLPYLWDTRTGDHKVLMTVICASVTPSHTPSSVHVMHAKHLIGWRTIPIGVFFPNPGLMHLTLAGITTITTAQMFYLLIRKSPVSIEKLSCLTW